MQTLLQVLRYGSSISHWRQIFLAHFV